MLRHVLPGAALVLLAPISAPAQSPVPELLPLPRAIEIALAQNRTLRAAALDVSRAQDETAATETHRWPAINMTFFESMLLAPVEFLFPQGTFGTYPGTGPIPGVDRT